jgi:hypothetical protein
LFKMNKAWVILSFHCLFKTANFFLFFNVFIVFSTAHYRLGFWSNFIFKFLQYFVMQFFQFSSKIFRLI